MMANETVLAFPWLAAVPDTQQGDEALGFDKVQDYLRRFGYLEDDESRVEVGTLDHPTEEALRRFQRFYQLPETGEFDDETRTAMMQPRCALPDTPTLSVGFATTCAWDHTDLTYALDT